LKARVSVAGSGAADTVVTAEALEPSEKVTVRARMRPGRNSLLR
jgi:hypothetical protein